MLISSSQRPGTRFCQASVAAKLNQEDRESTAQDAAGHVVLVQSLPHSDTHNGHEAAFQRPSIPANHSVLYACNILILVQHHSINITHRDVETNNALIALGLPGTCSLIPIYYEAGCIYTSSTTLQPTLVG